MNGPRGRGFISYAVICKLPSHSKAKLLLTNSYLLFHSVVTGAS